MTILGKFEKQISETIDYNFDYSEWLNDRQDSIGSMTVTCEPPANGGPPLVVSAITQYGGVVKAYLSGGVNGQSYVVTCTVTIASMPPRIKEAELIIRIRET